MRHAGRQRLEAYRQMGAAQRIVAQLGEILAVPQERPQGGNRLRELCDGVADKVGGRRISVELHEQDRPPWWRHCKAFGERNGVEPRDNPRGVRRNRV